MIRLRSLLVFILVSALLSVVAYALYEVESRAIVSVRVAGTLSYTSEAQLEAVVGDHLSASLYRVNVDAIRDAALSLPWVKDTSVRRVWPDSLHLAVVEREPVARWPQGGLIESAGEVFFPGSTSAFSHLPLLEGPPGTNALMLEKLRELQVRMRPAGWEITRLVLNRRGSWFAELNNQVALLLGQQPDDKIVQKFIDAFDTVLASRAVDLVQADLRYTNGFSVRWKFAKAAETQLDLKGEGGQG